MVTYVVMFGMWAWGESPHNLIVLLDSEYYKGDCWVLCSVVIADAGKMGGRQVVGGSYMMS